MIKAMELIFEKEADRLFDDFAVSFGVKMTFFSSSHEPVNRGLHNRISPYCSLVQNELGLGEACREEDRRRCSEAREIGAPHCYTCHAGLIEAVVPVYMENTLIGYSVMGQIGRDDTPPGALMALAEEKAGGSRPLIQAYRERPRFSENQFGHMLNLFQYIMKGLVEKSLVSLRGNLAVEDVLTLLRNNWENPLTLEEASQRVGRSPSSLSHLFKSHLGKSFKEVQLEMKFDRADRFFIDRPDMTVSDVCFRLGFSDPAYFSRIYKKYRGNSPGRRAKALRNNR